MGDRGPRAPRRQWLESCPVLRESLAVEAEGGGLTISAEGFAHVQAVIHPPRIAGRLGSSWGGLALDGFQGVPRCRVEAFELESRIGASLLGGVDKLENHGLAFVAVDCLRG